MTNSRFDDKIILLSKNINELESYLDKKRREDKIWSRVRTRLR